MKRANETRKKSYNAIWFSKSLLQIMQFVYVVIAFKEKKSSEHFLFSEVEQLKEELEVKKELSKQ